MKILLAYDGFAHSKHALEEVAELAADGCAEVTIMSVVPEAEARGSKSGWQRLFRMQGSRSPARNWTVSSSR